MLTIGITGSFGTGKTTVAKMFARLGAGAMDADKIAHNLMLPGEKCFAPVVKLFGNGVLTAGRIDRKKISIIVFDDPVQLKKLCAIVHPEVIEHIKKQIGYYRRENKVKVVVLDAPLLMEAGLEYLVDILVVVRANREKQINRVRRFFGIAPREAIKRIRAQMPIKEKIKRADIVIDNRRTLRETKKQVEAIWQRLQIRN